MPTMKQIVDYWHENEQPWLKGWYIGWGEPFCFACGWLPPIWDGSWSLAHRWLDRAHLHDRAFGGPDEPSNLVPLCHLCHLDMPDSPTRTHGLNWVKDHRTRDFLFQLWTDVRLRNRTPTRPTTLIQARMKFLEAIAEIDAQGAVTRPNRHIPSRRRSVSSPTDQLPLLWGSDMPPTAIPTDRGRR